MMGSAQDKGQIPLECFAKKGSNCVNAVMTKIMFCDESRTHHCPTCIGGNDFGDCTTGLHTHLQALPYKAGVYPVNWFALIAMQTMRFNLHTGYGESANTYGGSEEDRQLGLGQGNAAAGPEFMAASMPIVNAYL